jgi:hypothetical protein
VSHPHSIVARMGHLDGDIQGGRGYLPRVGGAQLCGARRSFRRSFRIGGARGGGLCLSSLFLLTFAYGGTRAHSSHAPWGLCGVRRTRTIGGRFAFVGEGRAHLRIYQSNAGGGGGVPRLRCRLTSWLSCTSWGWLFQLVSFRFFLLFFFPIHFFCISLFFAVWRRRRMLRREIACAYRRVSASVDSLGDVETCTHDPRDSGAVLFGRRTFFFVLGKKIEREEGSGRSIGRSGMEADNDRRRYGESAVLRLLCDKAPRSRDFSSILILFLSFVF